MAFFIGAWVADAIRDKHEHPDENTWAALGNAGEDVFGKMPVIGKFWGPLRDCLAGANDEQLQQIAKYQWMHEFSAPVALFTGVLVEYWSFRTYGPVPGALLAGPIGAALVYWIVDGAVCWLQGESPIFCPLAGLESLFNSLVRNVTGVNLAGIEQSAVSAERKALGALGCKNENK